MDHTDTSSIRIVPTDHPRAESLRTRELLVTGFERGLVAVEGLMAHGRGEAFDYLLGETTTGTSEIAIMTAAACLLLARHPVISVNGNISALCSSQVVELSKLTGAALEVNLFYRTDDRELAIDKELRINGALSVLGVGHRASASIPELQSQRRRVDPEGILAADTVLVPLEDGDRTEALVKMGKTVITIDLNPLSRTSKAAQISIVDNVVRAIPAMVQSVKDLRDATNFTKRMIVESFDNAKNLEEMLKIIRGGVR